MKIYASKGSSGREKSRKISAQNSLPSIERRESHRSSRKGSWTDNQSGASTVLPAIAMDCTASESERDIAFIKSSIITHVSGTSAKPIETAHISLSECERHSDLDLSEIPAKVKPLKDSDTDGRKRLLRRITVSDSDADDDYDEQIENDDVLKRTDERPGALSWHLAASHASRRSTTCLVSTGKTDKSNTDHVQSLEVGKVQIHESLDSHMNENQPTYNNLLQIQLGNADTRRLRSHREIALSEDEMECTGVPTIENCVNSQADNRSNGKNGNRRGVLSQKNIDTDSDSDQRGDASESINHDDAITSQEPIPKSVVNDKRFKMKPINVESILEKHERVIRDRRTPGISASRVAKAESADLSNHKDAKALNLLAIHNQKKFVNHGINILSICLTSIVSFSVRRRRVSKRGALCREEGQHTLDSM